MPAVLVKFAEAGCAMDAVDVNGNTPIEIAVTNKCYQSVEVLAKMGLRPKQAVMDRCDSPAIH